MRTRFASHNAINESTNKSRIYDRHQRQKGELGSHSKRAVGKRFTINAA